MNRYEVSYYYYEGTFEGNIYIEYHNFIYFIYFGKSCIEGIYISMIIYNNKGYSIGWY